MVEKKRKKQRDYMRDFRKAEREFIKKARLEMPMEWKRIAGQFGIEAGKRGPKKKRKRKKR